jgi:transposase
MPTTFRPCAPDQSLLFPPSPRDWLPEGHLAFFIADTVAALDLSGLYAPYEGDGRRNQPFDPQMMVTVLVYAYATGTFSSRGIARKLEEDVAYRMLAAGNFPAHRTLADFRQQHLATFEALFVQVVQIAQEAGVVRLGAVAVDGTKVKANANKHKAMSYQRMGERARQLRMQRRMRRTGETSAGMNSPPRCADARTGSRPLPPPRRGSKRGKRPRIAPRAAPRTTDERVVARSPSRVSSGCRPMTRRTTSRIPRVGS